MNKKLGFDTEEISEKSTLTKDDIVASMRYIIALHDGVEGYTLDDIDHFGNRRIGRRVQKVRQA